MSKEQWVGYLDPQSKSAASIEYPSSKQIFIDSIRASSTCPYISPSIPDDVLANDWAKDMQHRGPQTMDRLADQFKSML